MEPGTQLGHYEILSAIGKGGMGEVWRARDTKLGREVAIKTLPPEFAQDEERLARFEREAKLLASLNHPNIAAIYGLEEHEGSRFLVLELVEGDTLADRLKPGAIPVEEALKLALQIAEALEAAHEKGVIHRDLKPANIKLTPDGKVKVLDFGLAKAFIGEEGDVNLSNSPTLSMQATRQGVILGTAAYMSPEQARGETADKQVDIWAFGCVLYEMLAGRPSFDGKTVSDLLASVLKSDPDWESLPNNLHPRIRPLLERCLEKEAKNRCHDVADARADIQRALADPSGVLVSPIESATAAQSSKLRSAAAVILAVLVAGAGGWFLKPSEPGRISRLSQVLSMVPNGGLAIARNGTQVVYGAAGRLNLRPLDGLESTPIRGSEGAAFPMFSPDGQSIAYFADQKLRKIAIDGGTSVDLADAVGPAYGGSWSADDTIVYALETGIWQVPADGGTPVQLVEPEPGEQVYGPQILPDGTSVLFTLLNTPLGPGWRAWDVADIVIQSLETGNRQVLVSGGSDGRFVPTGHLVYALNTVLFAVPFDAASKEVLGGRVPIVEGVRRAGRSPGSSALAYYAFSGDGTLAYVPGIEPGAVPRNLVSVDREGNAELLTDEQRDYWRPRISPDGTRIVVEVNNDVGEFQLWIVNLELGTGRPLTFEGSASIFPAWTPDGESIVFRSTRELYGISQKSADGQGEEALLHQGPNEFIPTDVSDGVVVFSEGPRVGESGIYTLRLEDGEVSDFVVTPASENMGMFSPDGRWLAYASDETGQYEIYVRPYPRVQGSVSRVSDGGGSGPVWSPTGSELYYRSSSGDIVAVSVQLNPIFSRVGQERPLFRFSGRFRTSGNTSAYDIHPHGDRFIMVTEPETPPAAQPQQINVVLNWFQELRERVPVD